jgi:tetratricopeptide (TPR) repeat protein
MWDRAGSTQHLVMGDEAGALKSYQRCLGFAEQWSAIDPQAAMKTVALSRQMVALFRARTGDTAGAEDTILQSIRAYKLSPTWERSITERRNVAKAYKNLAEAQRLNGNLPQALSSVRESLKISEDQLAKDRQNLLFQIDVHQGMAFLVDLLIQSGKTDEARAGTERALAFLKPLIEQNDASVYQIQAYAELLVTTPFSDLQNKAAALQYARKAVDMTHEKDPTALDALARAYAKTSRFNEAVRFEEKAVGLLPPAEPGQGAPELRKTLEANLAAFRLETRPSQARR